MTFPGFLALGLDDEFAVPPTHAVEIVNNNRAYAYADSVGLPWLTECDMCLDVEDISSGGEGYSTPVADPAPWYDQRFADSSGFLGVIGLDIVGADGSTRSATVTPALTGGGVVGAAYEGPRTMIVRAIAIGLDECGLSYGLRWLNDQFFGPFGDPCSGDPLTFFECCPGFCEDDGPVGPCWPINYGEMADGPDCAYDWWPETYEEMLLGPPNLRIGTTGDWCDWVGVYRELRTWLPPWSCCVETRLIPQMKQFARARVTSGPNVLRRPTMSVGALAEIEFTIVAADPDARRHQFHWTETWLGNTYTPPGPRWYGSEATIEIEYSTGTWMVPQVLTGSPATIRVAAVSGVFPSRPQMIGSVASMRVSAATGTWVSGCTDVLSEPFNNFTDAPWAVGATPVIVAGRTGTAAQCNSIGDTLTYSIPGPAVSPYVTIGMAHRTSLLAIQEVFALVRSADSIAQFNVNLISDGSLQVLRNNSGTFLGGTAVGLIAANTWNYIEMQVYSHDTLGTVVVRLNGTTVINVGPLDTRATGDPDRVRLSYEAGATILRDDLYISTGAGCTFKGDHTIP